MFRPRAARKSDLAKASLRFALYVEGPRDHDVLRLFAQKLSPELARVMDPCVRILGGRQPARAAELFGSMVERAVESDEGAPRGLCVLDRDDPLLFTSNATSAFTRDDAENTELEFVVWKRRQIESYLMVPCAIRRCLSKHRSDSQLDRMLESWLPDPSDEDAFRKLDAKRVLGVRGPIANYLGRPLRAQEIVRNMSPLDVHTDVKEVLARVRDHLGSSSRPSIRPGRLARSGIDCVS